MKFLVGIPALYGYQHTKNAIESVLNQNDVDLLLIDNGGDDDINRIVEEYESHLSVKIIRNQKNIYVNPAWNQIIKYFLKTDCPVYDLLCIMNSDLALNKGWSEVIRKRLRAKQNESFVPKIATDMRLFERVADPSYMEAQTVTEGTAGVFITLTKKQAELVYPIPETIKIWFGDQFVYERLRKNGYVTVIPESLIAIHGNSQTVSRLPGISELIEIDKLEWEKIKHSV